MDAVVGRDDGLRRVRVFLHEAREGACALLLEGETGTGKTTLWLAGVDTAREGPLGCWRRDRERRSAASPTQASGIVVDVRAYLTGRTVTGTGVLGCDAVATL